MAENLWELRQRRNRTVKQLAGKSGVAAKNIYAYENGELIRMADLQKLAKALYVNSADIKIQSDPIPKSTPKQAPPPRTKPDAKKPEPATAVKSVKSTATQKPPKQPAQPPPATEGQLDHLRTLTANTGETETAVSERIGKPLSELTFQEARTWLRTYDKENKARKAEMMGERPPDTRRWRAHLPEGVDAFEIDYLQARQEAGDTVTFVMLNETEFTGQIMGFSPFSITIRQVDGAETTIQKLALAYYHVAPDEAQP